MLQKILNKIFYKNSIKKIEEDNYIKRLPSSVIGQGMLHEGNIYLIDFAIRNMPSDGYVIEIGSYGGLSTNLILHLLNKHNKNNLLLGCDAWQYEGYNDFKGTKANYIDGNTKISRKEYMNYIKEAFINTTKFLNPNSLPYICHLNSNDFFMRWGNKESLTDVFGRKFSITKKISFAYIDGDHSYNQTKKDFFNVSQNLMVNGYILIDDSADNLSFGSAKFISVIKQNPNFKIVDKNPNYLIQKIK
jgi:hypothetical protein